MRVKTDKLYNRLQETWPAHIISSAGFVLGIFAPLPAIVITCVLILGYVAYDFKARDEEEKQKFTPSNLVASSTKSAKNIFNNMNSYMSSQDENEKLLNKSITDVCSMQNRQIAMTSILFGTANGIGIGLVIMLAPAALVLPISLSVVASIFLLTFAAAQWKNLSSCVQGIKNDYQGSTKVTPLPDEKFVNNSKGNRRDFSIYLDKYRNKKS